MRKSVKIIIIVLSVFVSIIILDTLQARIFKGSPIISWKEELNNKNNYVKRGILIDTFYCTKENDIQTIYWKFKGSKFNCFIGDNISYRDIMDIMNNYFAKENTDKSNMAYWTIDEEKNIVVVGMMDISEEKQNEFYDNVFSSCCDLNYIKDNKMIEFRESIDIFKGKIIEVKEKLITVEVMENCESFKKGDKVSMKITRDINYLYKVGDKVRVTFNGMVEESNPAQIGASKIELINE